MTGNPHFRFVMRALSWTFVRLRHRVFMNRHTCDLGGAGWLATILLTPCTCIVTSVTYSRFFVGEHKMADATLCWAVGSLLTVWVVGLGTFLLSLDRAYLHTFYTFETSLQFTQRWFAHNVGSDQFRVVIFTFNERLWHPIRAAVVDWVHARYAAWTSESWLTPAVRATIPAWAIPNLDSAAD